MNKVSKTATKPISVLVVEDEPALNEAYVRILQAQNFKASSSFNGEEALNKLKNLRPDIILLDLKMPKMGGIEFLNEYSKIASRRKSKIIVFSNYDEQKEVKDAFTLGASRYMLKAWASPKELVKVVKETAQAVD